MQHEKVYSDDKFLVKVRSCGFFLVSAKSETIVYDIGYETETNDIEVKLKFTPKEQVTTINPCILYSDAFRKPFFDLLSSFL